MLRHGTASIAGKWLLPHNSSMRYRREIDGLRAIAVLPVIFFHAGFEAFRGGFVGVDVFFVISGYLITSIILSEMERGVFSLSRFYERRARRILPALLLVMLACLPFAWMWLSRTDLEDFSQSLVAVSTFAANFLFWQESGYFDTAAELKPLLHTWSLAVEEQFYLLFPLFLLVCRRFDVRWTSVALGSVFMLSLASAVWASAAMPAAAFYLLPTRCWELLLGASAVFIPRQHGVRHYGRAIGELGGWGGLALILYSVLRFDEGTTFPGLYALVPTVGALLVIVFAQAGTTVAALLGHRALVGLGLISYSAYLWHQPIFAFAKHAPVPDLTAGSFVFLSLLSFGLAYLTWRFIESPFRSEERVDRRWIVLLSLSGPALFAGIGLAVLSNMEAIQRYKTGLMTETQRGFYSIVSEMDVVDDHFPRNAGTGTENACRFNIKVIDPSVAARMNGCFRSHGSGVLILGDSHAIDLFGSVLSRFDDRFVVGVTSAGCRPHTSRPECQYASTIEFLRDHPGVFRHVIYEQAGFYLLLDERGRKGTRLMFSRLSLSQPVEGVMVDREHLTRTLDYLLIVSRHVPVTWLLPRVEHHIDRRHLLRLGCRYPYALRPGLREAFDLLDSAISKSVEALPEGVRLEAVSQIDLYAIAFPQDLLDCRNLFWSDGDHYSASGEVRFGKRLPDGFLEFRGGGGSGPGPLGFEPRTKGL
jgi:peptidoglycan/LPS O-acetylase OafA/YrhL